MGSTLTSVFILLIQATFSLCLLIVSPTGAVGQSIEVRGIVLDQNASVIPQATVTIELGNGSQTTTTTAEGKFSFSLPQASTLTLSVTADRFQPYRRQLHESELPNELSIVLLVSGLAERVNVTATRTETRLSETPASVVVLDNSVLTSTAAIATDDALRQVTGFSLFRRTGSRVANPTTQGVSLRGLGASGASRAIVLVDDIPLNDPFGGWVYWGRVPRDSISQVEIVRGPTSHLYGSTALGGVINLRTLSSPASIASLTLSYGNEQTPDGSLFLSLKHGPWLASIAAEAFNTRGYILVSEDERGPIDTRASSRFATVNTRVSRELSSQAHLFAAAAFFRESRGNGTPVQTNRTHIRQFSLGGDVQNDAIGFLKARVYGGTQVFNQNFSAVNSNRTAESLTRLQRTPAQVLALSGEWNCGFGELHTVVAGFDWREVRGASDEISFANNRAVSLIGAGGKERAFGLFLEDLFTFKQRIFVTAGLRIDRWRNFDALSVITPLSSAVGSAVSFSDRQETALSPHAAALFNVNSRFALTVSIARAFRAPTLNELYRSFRVGNVLTLANENLRAERLLSTEVGSRVSLLNDAFVFRANAFWNRLNKPVANITLAINPNLITRQRQNLGQIRSRGIELEAEARVRRYWAISGSYLLADSTVASFPANSSLEGNWIPQIARHQFTFQTRYSNPAIGTFAIQARGSGHQFDDDQNSFLLGRYFQLDAYAARRLSSQVEPFLAVENLFNQRYDVGKTPVTTIGPPVLIRVGLRIQFGNR